MKYKTKHPNANPKGFKNINPIPENIKNVNKPNNNINKAIPGFANTNIIIKIKPSNSNMFIHFLFLVILFYILRILFSLL